MQKMKQRIFDKFVLLYSASELKAEPVTGKNGVILKSAL
jgi:hypothetical protein